MNSLLKAIEDNTAVVGIIGLGYVGIPLSVSVSRAGLRVLGFDIMVERASELNDGKSPIKHIADSEIVAMARTGFEATTDFSRAGECDALIICVPTPLNKSREPDLSFVTATMDSIAPYLRQGQLLSLESTTWPGTTKQVLLPYVEEAGLKVGENFYLV